MKKNLSVKAKLYMVLIFILLYAPIFVLIF